jgi:hypothetical protein
LKKSKIKVVDHPILTDPSDENCATYQQIKKEGMLSSKDAIAFINRKLIRNGVTISPDTFYHRVYSGNIRALKINKRYFFNPKDLDTFSFNPKERFQAPPQEQAVRVHSLKELQALSEKYGPLVDMQGMVDALEKKPQRPYTLGAIKQRLRRGTIWYVAYTGDKRRHYWFPLSQVEYMYLQPKNEERVLEDSSVG